MRQSLNDKSESFIQPLPVYYYVDDGISLVDIAKVLVKRRRLMAVVFFFVIAIALAFSFFTPKEYTYTTIYTPARIDPITELEPVSNLKSKVNSVYVPEQVRSMLKQQGSKLIKFNLTVSNPKGTGLLFVSSDVTEEQSEQVVELQNMVIQKLKMEQNSEVDRRKELLRAKMKSAKEQLIALSDESFKGNGELVVGLMDVIGQLESEINSFSKGYMSESATKSITPKGFGNFFVLVLGVIMGSMLAIIAAFLVEFASKVCRSLNEEQVKI